MAEFSRRLAPTCRRHPHKRTSDLSPPPPTSQTLAPANNGATHVAKNAAMQSASCSGANNGPQKTLSARRTGRRRIRTSETPPLSAQHPVRNSVGNIVRHSLRNTVKNPGRNTVRNPVRMMPLPTPLVLSRPSKIGRPANEPIVRLPYKNVESEYVLGQKVGEGVSGSVRICTSRRTGDVYACKTMQKSTMMGERDVTAVRTEVRAMRRVRNHWGVARVEGVVEDEKNVHIIMDYCEGGNLLDRIREQKRFSEKDAARIFRQLLSVVHYLHSKNVMHRDLKPENILLMSASSDLSIKVVDFGQAALFKKGVKQKQAVGTPYYVAPEVLNRSYGAEADLWSLGAILYILLSGVPPFWAKSRSSIFAKIKTADFNMETGPWIHISDGAKNLVSRLLCLDPEERITAKLAKEHTWIQQHCGIHKIQAPSSSYMSLSEYSTVSDGTTRTKRLPSVTSRSSQRCPSTLVSSDVLSSLDALSDWPFLSTSRSAYSYAPGSSSYGQVSPSFSSSSFDSDVSSPSDEGIPYGSRRSYRNYFYESRQISTYTSHHRRRRFGCRVPCGFQFYCHSWRFFGKEKKAARSFRK